MTNQPFHAGELAVQARAGEREMADAVGEMIGDAVPIGGRAFLANQRLLAVAGTDDAVGDDRRLWASVWFGAPGFATSSPDGREVAIDRPRDASGDPIAPRVGRRLGLLAIDLATRRRLRINGSITGIDGSVIRIAVAESYPNCPKYIVRRDVRDVTPSGTVVTGSTALEPAQLATLARADTAFVASRHAERGFDASHRGGPAGFIHAVDPSTLRVPDYAGNSMFQTLGNFAIDPSAALAVLDFAGGRILQMSGRARLVFEPERAWELAVERWIESPAPVAGAVR